MAGVDAYKVLRMGWGEGGGTDYETMMKHYAGFKLADRPWTMTCAAHGIGKSRRSKSKLD